MLKCVILTFCIPGKINTYTIRVVAGSAMEPFLSMMKELVNLSDICYVEDSNLGKQEKDEEEVLFNIHRIRENCLMLKMFTNKETLRLIESIVSNHRTVHSISIRNEDELRARRIARNEQNDIVNMILLDRSRKKS